MAQKLIIEYDESVEGIFDEIKKEKQNIVLIGMPGSGKTTIGKIIAGATGRDFVDTDEMIVKKHGEISKIFAVKGEAYFRTLEAEAVKEASKRSGCIIATGGGAVLKKENVKALKQNGVLFFLNRPLSDIVPTQDRPLSSNRESIEK